MSNSVWPHRRQPTRLPHPWDSPGKNTGVGCHFLLQWMKVKSESEVVQSCPTLSNAMDCSLPGSSVHGCQEPAWGTPPMANVIRKEVRHTQRQDLASGIPLEILKHLSPKLESAYFTALCSHLHLWLYGGLSPTTSLWKRVNLELQLIKIPGRDKSVSTYKLLWRFSSLPNRLVWPHVIVHSLPTERGMRCSKLSKNRFFWEVRKLLI